MKKHWIEKRLEELKDKGVKVNKVGLAKALGLEPPYITKIIKKERQIQPKEYGPISSYLDIDTATVFFNETGINLNPATIPPSSPQTIPVIGEVQAGTWRECVEWPKDEWIYVPLVIENDSYPGVSRFGLKVVGPSMNKVMPEGYVAICVKYFDIEQEPQDGDYVVVYRTRHDLIEATIKQYKINGRLELWPLSHHPDHQKPLIPEVEAEKGDTIAIHAKVIQAITDL